MLHGPPSTLHLPPAVSGAILALSCLAVVARAQVVETVVVTDTPLWGSLTAVEKLRIGVAEGEAAYQFGSISAIALASDGSVLVADRDGPSVRRYDARGKYLHDIGRSGEGPGEYNSVLGMEVLRDGTVTVWDPRNRRLSFFELDGTFKDSFPVNVGTFGSRVFYVDGADNFFYRTLHLDPNVERKPGEQLPEVYLEVGRDGVEKRRIRIPESDWPASYVLATSEGYHRPFSGQLDHAVSADGELIVGNNMTYTLEFERDGAPIRRIRVPYEVIEVGAAEWRQWRDWSAYMTDKNPGGTVFATPPKTKPAYRGLWVDRDGRIWVRRYGVATRFDVEPREPGDTRPLLEWRDKPTFDILDAAGVLIGHVTFPSGVFVYNARGRMALAEYTDDQGVPYVVVFEIR